MQVFRISSLLSVQRSGLPKSGSGCAQRLRPASRHLRWPAAWGVTCLNATHIANTRRGTEPGRITCACARRLCLNPIPQLT